MPSRSRSSLRASSPLSRMKIKIKNLKDPAPNCMISNLSMIVWKSTLPKSNKIIKGSRNDSFRWKEGPKESVRPMTTKLHSNSGWRRLDNLISTWPRNKSYVSFSCSKSNKVPSKRPVRLYTWEWVASVRHVISISKILVTQTRPSLPCVMRFTKPNPA